MAILTVQSLSKDFGIKEILTQANFSLEETDKVGLIGMNGSGKSTFLKMLAGLEPMDSGELWVLGSAKIVYLPQQPTINPDYTVLEQVFNDTGEALQLIKDYEDISSKLGSTEGSEHDQLMEKLGVISHRMDMIGAWELETQAKIILTKLGITDYTAKMGSLSGGYCKRIALAAALLSTPDALLLDEPTNHLDASSVEWLQGYLKSYQGALLLITHDRYFLDQVTNRIVEIDRANLYSYSGNYSYFLMQKAAVEEADQSSRQKFKGVLRRELEWLQRGAKARSTKQRARIQRIEGMQNKEWKEGVGKVEISTVGTRIGKKVRSLFN